MDWCRWQERKVKELSFIIWFDSQSPCLCSWIWCFNENHWNTKVRFSCSLEWNVVYFEIQVCCDTKAELHLLIVMNRPQSVQHFQIHKGAIRAYYCWFQNCAQRTQDCQRVGERALDYKSANLLLSSHVAAWESLLDVSGLCFLHP
jgi:hypothetical protein